MWQKNELQHASCSVGKRSSASAFRRFCGSSKGLWYRNDRGTTTYGKRCGADHPAAYRWQCGKDIHHCKIFHTKRKMTSIKRVSLECGSRAFSWRLPAGLDRTYIMRKHINAVTALEGDRTELMRLRGEREENDNLPIDHSRSSYFFWWWTRGYAGGKIVDLIDAKKQ